MMRRKIGIEKVLFLIVVLYYIIGSSIAQHDISTDPARCCKRVPNTTYADSTCRSTKLNANQFQQSITTPNYPKAFQPDTFCQWEIFATPGRRILLDFRNMHLIAKDNNECVSQRVVVFSPLTGLTMGPFCGHDGLPNVVSTGNHIIVELQSPNPTNGRQYKGFQLVYMETVQATSIGLRPPDWSDGMYLEYQRPGPSTRPPRYNSNRNRNTPPITKNPPVIITNKSLKPKDQKKKPAKERDRVMSNPNRVRNIGPYPYIPPPRIPTRIGEEKPQDGMGTEAIIGIVVGGILLVAILSVVVAKVSQHRSAKKRKREEQDEELAIQYPSGNPQKPSRLPSFWDTVQLTEVRPSMKPRAENATRMNEQTKRRQERPPRKSRSRGKSEESAKTPRSRPKPDSDKTRSKRPPGSAKRTDSNGKARNERDRSDTRQRRSDGRSRKKTNNQTRR